MLERGENKLLRGCGTAMAEDQDRLGNWHSKVCSEIKKLEEKGQMDTPGECGSESYDQTEAQIVEQDERN